MTTSQVDFLGLQSQLSEEETAIQDLVRHFVQDRVAPDIGEWFDQGHLPREIAHELGALGLFGMQIDGYGCTGANAVSYGIACLELERVDSGLRSLVSVQGSLAMHAIHAYGSDEQRDQWLPQMATGEIIGCFALTEPDSGSDPASMRTNARRDGSDWILNGTKAWITNGNLADVAVVWARTADGIRGFVVPTSSPGFQAILVTKKLSLRASVTSDLILEEVRVPRTAMLPGTRGLGAALACLNEARFGIVWGAVGAASACYETALSYASTREQFGRPISSFQLTQRKLVEMMMEVQKATMVALRIGRMKDEGTLLPEHISFGKLNNVREALSVARAARTVLGASGITLDYPVFRHMVNLESVLTYEGTSEIHLLTIGRALTGHAAFQ